VATIAASVARYPVPDQEQYSDRWNAQKLIAKCGNDLRYVPAWRVWLVWDGKRWKRDDTQQAERWADDVIRSLYAEAAQITDSAKRQELAEWARRSESAHAQEAMLRTAEKFVAIAPGQLDSDPMLFNVLNGTLNLQTGKLRPHRREDLLTKIAGAKYLAGATQPVWTRFLREATGGNRQLAAFLARAVGYSLTGDTGEEKLFFVHGPTATGKSTFLEAVKSAMGEYAASADFETFLSKPTGGGIRNDIARLAGARFVASLEMEDGRKLAEGLVKQLTGGDTIAARFLYAESFEFRPQFKLWLAANSEPKADDSDGALWRRILRVPFDREIPKDKRDPEIKKTLRDDPEARAAILAWAVKGLRAWRKTGLGVPPVVEKATEAYRRRQNPLSEFVEARCEATAGAWISSANLRLAYEIWAQGNDEAKLSGKEFAKHLTSLGFTAKRKKTERGWAGISIKRGGDG
jgi:putative DNA primase/helicase